MRHALEYRNLTEEQKNQALSECHRYLNALDRKLAGCPAFLHGVAEKHPTRTLYRVSLTLHLPRRLLPAKEESPHAEEALQEAFTELERQLEKHKAFLHRDHLWHRPSRLVQPHLKSPITLCAEYWPISRPWGTSFPGSLPPRRPLLQPCFRDTRHLSGVPQSWK